MVDTGQSLKNEFNFRRTCLYHRLYFCLLSTFKNSVKQNTMQNWSIPFGLHIQKNLWNIIVYVFWSWQSFNQFTNQECTKSSFFVVILNVNVDNMNQIWARIEIKYNYLWSVGVRYIFLVTIAILLKNLWIIFEVIRLQN